MNAASHEPRLLTLQTATAGGGVALTQGEQLVGELSLNVRQTPAAWLLNAVDTLLVNAGWSLAELDGFGVVSGPGAFTGLRVGMATVKGLAIAVNRPVAAVSSLECLALQVPFSALPLCTMLDARKQEVYAALFAWENGRIRSLAEEVVVPPEVFLEKCSAETVFVGSGATVYRTLITRALGPRAHFLPGLFDLPRAGLAAQLVLKEWQAGRMQAAEQVQPRYIRPSEAELNQADRVRQ